MSKDVAALRWLLPPRYRFDAEEGMTLDPHGTWVLAHTVLSPNAVLIDPTAPETVAALAAALFDGLGWPTRKLVKPTPRSHGYIATLPYGLTVGDPDNPEWARAAAAILPAFVARLRGET